MSTVRYRVQREDYTPPDDHTKVGEDEYVAPNADSLDALEEGGAIEVLDWSHEPDGEVTYSGPPEPVVKPDGTVAVVTVLNDDTRPNEAPRLTETTLDTWVCEKCGVEKYVSYTDSEFQQPDKCSSCGQQGTFMQAGVEKEAIQAALRAADGLWRPPTGYTDERFADLWDDVRAFIRDHWDAGEDEDVYDGLTAYVLSSWLRENLSFVLHLMLMGKTTAGKTRLLNTLARVSYRALVSASATSSSMFRLIDEYDTTFYVSEYHGLSPDTQRALDNVVRAGQKRGEIVTRAEPTSDGYEPMSFDPFSHVAIATQYEPADDIVNRCVLVRSSPQRREMPPIVDDDRATAIRDRLLYARFRLLDSDEWATAEQEAYRILAERNITGRTREKLLSLLTVAVVWNRVDALEPFIDTLVEQDHQAAADSEDAIFIQVVRDLAFDAVGDTAVLGGADPFGTIEIPLSEVAEGYERITGTEKTPSWAGQVRARLNLEKARRSDGTVISDSELGPKLQRLCDENNLDWERLDAHSPVEALAEDEQGRGTCSECGKNASLTHRHSEDGYHMCESCAVELDAASG